MSVTLMAYGPENGCAGQAVGVLLGTDNVLEMSAVVETLVAGGVRSCSTAGLDAPQPAPFAVM